MFILLKFRTRLSCILPAAALGLLFSSPSLAGNNAGQGFATWPDTGQTTCYGTGGAILNPCPSPGQPFYGQDAQYVGPARSYTKLDSSGNPLAESASSWAMVRDNVTGLTWEAKQDKNNVSDYSNPHDADNSYTWCDTDPNTNGGSQGNCGASYNDTEDFLADLNGSGFGGHSDWRLPTINELKTLLDRSRVNPAISITYFPNTVSSVYWSSTTCAAAESGVGAWRMGFDGGWHSYCDWKSAIYHVHAVRGGQ